MGILVGSHVSRREIQNRQQAVHTFICYVQRVYAFMVAVTVVEWQLNPRERIYCCLLLRLWLLLARLRMVSTLLSGANRRCVASPVVAVVVANVTGG